MSTILSVEGGPRGERSHSREVGRVAIPAVTEGWIAATFHPENEARSEQTLADLAKSF
ncbi:FMN-dependent NADH-azoreductase 1 [compost metagenome]